MNFTAIRIRTFRSTPFLTAQFGPSRTHACVVSIAHSDIRYRLSDAERRARSERLRQLNADPQFARKRTKGASENMKRLHADPSFAARAAKRASERMTRLNADPDFKTKITAARAQRQVQRAVLK